MRASAEPLDKRKLNMFVSKAVWELRPINEARTKMGRSPISVRWVEVNKGDDQNPNIRSRLVVREIRLAGQDAIFAPTPPLESLRMVLSMATTKFEGGKGIQPNFINSSHEHTPMEVFNVTRGKRYRFRTISNGVLNCPIEVKFVLFYLKNKIS